MGGGQTPAHVAHIDDEDEFEWEIRDDATPFWQHAVAGSCAGVMEHVGMYPIDTVKTRIQASPAMMSATEAVGNIWRERGLLGFMRGATVIGFGCIPAHIGLFTTYECAKAQLLDLDGNKHQPMRAAACGAVGTVAHDAILTPCDVVKQRLQMGGYRGVVDCITSTARVEGISAFYRSLPATLAMNIPYMGVLVASNESLKRVLQLNAVAGRETGHSDRIGWHFLTAGISGGFAATLTIPLDVIKTRIQVQGGASEAHSAGETAEVGIRRPRYSGILSTMEVIYASEGLAGFFRGLGPRMMLAMPSAAMCWGTYETVRVLLAYGSGTGSSASASNSAEDYEWEEWDRSAPFWQHAVAGSAAGMMEHVAMYPVDTVKTRMQAAPPEPGGPVPGAVQICRDIVREQGGRGFMRGCFAIGAGCIPAHIGLFCTYEFTKTKLMNVENPAHQPLRAATCGALATVVHDMIITPTDVVKQRLQLGCYRGTFDCIASIWRQEGMRAFYRSLPTTLISECPFHGVLVASNESLKLLLGLEARGGEQRTQAAAPLHFLSTGISGMIAAVVTQPLDVVKTRLQTQNVWASQSTEVKVRYSGMLNTMTLIAKEEGMRGFFRGTGPRLLFAAPSAAMCWGTYEVVKLMLRDGSH